MKLKKWSAFLLIFVLLMGGCGAQETFETIADEIEPGQISPMRFVMLSLPNEASSPTVESDAGRIYQCGEYDICVETLSAGDLNETVAALSGYDREKLTIMQTERDGTACYEFVWASAGDTGDRIGRAMILDDGNYHYCVSIFGNADTARKNAATWDAIFQSVSLCE